MILRSMPSDTLATLTSRMADARQAIAESFFAPWANSLAGLLVPSVRLHVVAGAAFGRSRFGGEPALPADEAWPTDGAGAPYDFLAQLDLAEVRALLGKTALPAGGALLFFGGSEGGRVLHVAGDGALQRRPLPQGASLHRECSLVLSPECCLPDPELAYGLGFDELPEEWVLHWELLTRRVQESERTEHRLLGTATPPPTPLGLWQKDYPDEGAVASRMLRQNVINGRLKMSVVPGESRATEHPERFPVTLLQLDTDVGGPGWSWGRNGRLYFHADEEDLRRRALDACVVTFDPAGPL